MGRTFRVTAADVWINAHKGLAQIQGKPTASSVNGQTDGQNTDLHDEFIHAVEDKAAAGVFDTWAAELQSSPSHRDQDFLALLGKYRKTTYVHSKAKTNVTQARRFFQLLGIPVEASGLIPSELDERQTQQLATWQEATSSHGIIMTTEADFFRKILLAISLWPQRDGQKTNYLIGKGAGVEVALRGTIAGRERRPFQFSYRSHSDFELYGVTYEADDNGTNMGSSPYPPRFREIFGGQEYFPETKTKGLSHIPPGLLHATAETVDLGGVRVLVPQLELLFLDKFMRPEDTPRPEGHDAILLARQYVLDRKRVHEYLERFVIQPRVEQIQANVPTIVAYQVQGIKKKIQRLMEEAGKDSSLPDAVSALNEEMEGVIEHYKNFVEKPRLRAMIYSGIDPGLWESLTPEQLNSDGNITDQKVLQRIEETANRLSAAEIEECQALHQRVDIVLDEAQTGALWTS